MGLGEGECELRHKSTLGTTSAYLGNFLRFIRFHSVIIIRFYSVSFGIIRCCSVSFGFIRFYSFVLGVIPLSLVSCGFYSVVCGLIRFYSGPFQIYRKWPPEAECLTRYSQRLQDVHSLFDPIKRS